jgi:ATPase subunit of ABC transporter with duplicated ATPase domains
MPATLTSLFRRLRILRAAARDCQNEKQQQAQFERQQAMLAKEIKFIERFKARASHAAQVQSRVKKLEKIDRVEPPKRRQTVAFEFQPRAALGRGCGLC